MGNKSGPASQIPAELLTVIEPSQIPSPSVSGFNGFVAGFEDISLTSDKPSLSSSVSALFPIPSPSVSNHSLSSSGNASGPAIQIPAELLTAIGPSQ